MRGLRALRRDVFSFSAFDNRGDLPPEDILRNSNVLLCQNGFARLSGTLIALALTAGACFSQATIDLNRVVAVINGEEIKAAEYYRRVEILDLREPYSRFKGRMLQFPAGFLALDQLIQEKILVQVAKQKGVYPSDVEVNAELDWWTQNTADLKVNWEKIGRTPQELLQRVRLDLISFKLQSFGINVTDQEVAKHYEDNPAEFTTPKLYTLRVIVLTDAAKKEKVDADLKNGKTFAEAATAYSDDITKLRGGEYGNVALSGLPEIYGKPLSTTKVGQTTDWISTGEQSIKFFVESVTPEKLQPLDVKLKTQLRRKMMLDRGKVKNDLAKEVNRKLADAKIEIRQKEYVEPYNALIKQVKDSIGN
jgi:parvulin-like peptidyl-prolyl isomerase